MLDFLFVGRLRFHGIERNVVSFGPKFRDAILQLIQWSRNVWQLDNRTFWRLGQFTEIGQIVRYTLVLLERLWKGSQDAAGNGNVARNNVDVGDARKLANEMKSERVRSPETGPETVAATVVPTLRMMG